MTLHSSIWNYFVIGYLKLWLMVDAISKIFVFFLCSIDNYGLKELARCIYLIEEVDISSSRLTDSDMKHLSDGILAGVASGRGCNVKKIILADCSLSVDAMKELARCLPYVEYVDLSDNKLTVDHIMLISQCILAAVAISGSCNLKKLSLLYCSLDFTGMKELVKILEHVEEVDLRGNTLSYRHMQHICAQILTCMDNKYNINIPNSSIDVEGMRELAICMHHLEEVDLSGNTLLVGHIKHISNAILTAAANGRSTMKKLNISTCSIGIDGMKELARSIHLIEELDISDNKLTVSHINHFSTEILSTLANGGSCKLKNVNLSNCLINVAGMKKLARCLHLFGVVNLSGNKLTVNHVRHISDEILAAVSNGGSFDLRIVNLTDCSIDIAGIKELARCLHLLQYVILDSNKFTVNHVRHISDAILASASNGGRFALKRVELSYCLVDIAGIKKFAQCVHLVEEVDLSGNKLTVNHVQHISDGILEAVSNGGRFILKTLVLSGCSIDVAGIKELAQCVHLVEEINLSENKLTVNHVRHMSDGILAAVSNGGMFALKKVNLTNCSVDVAGIKELARCLHLVEEVNLGRNKLTVNHVQPISDGILTSDSNEGRFALKKVDLNDCSLDAAGIKEFAQCVHLVEEINLSGNKLTANHVQHISDGILAAVSNGGRFILKILVLNDCSIDVAGIKELAQCVHLVEEINLSGNKLTVNHVQHISDVILTADSNGGRFALKKVDLNDCSLDAAGIKELARCLHLFEEVNLSGNKLTVNHVQHISDGILTADSNGGRFALKKVDLNDCSLDAAGIKELARCLHLFEEVNLSGNKLTVNHVQHISHGILTADSNGGRFALKKVDLNDCSLDAAGIKELARCLHLLEEVDLSGNKLTVNHVRHISDGILAAVSNGGRFILKILVLSGCSIDVAGIKELAQCVHLVEEINLSGNKLTVNHVQHISDVILTADSNGGRFALKKADLNDCSLDAAGIKELARCLHLFEEVNLSGNKLTANHVQHISDVILTADSNGGRFALKKVDLNDRSLDAAGIKELARCLHLLEEVDLSGNKLTVNHVQHISDGLLTADSNGGRFAMKKVDLTDCFIDAAGIKGLVRCLHLLEEVNLSGNKLTVKHVRHISDGLLAAVLNGEMCALKKVNLENCLIDVAGFKELARCLHLVEEVNLGRNKLSVNHIQHLSDGILTADSNGGRFALKKVDLNNCSLDTTGMKELARFLHLVEEVDLTRNKLNVEHARHISDGLLAAVSNGGRFALKKVDLTDCSVDVAGIKELSQCVHLVEEVDLSGNKLTVNHVRHISDGILAAVSKRTMFALKKVNLTNCSIDVAGIKELARCLYLFEEVNLCGNRLTVHHVQHISDGLLAAVLNGEMCALKKVNLENCLIDVAGFKQLARCLHFVEEVNLSGHKLTANHVRHISEGILAAASNGGRFALKKVDLTYCSIDVAGIKELARCLHLLEEVNLSGNKLTVNHVRHISDGILAAASNGGRFALKKVDLTDCSIDVAGIKELARCLYLFGEVNVSGNILTINHVRHISDGILAAVLNGETCALKKVNLANCLIDVASFKELAQCLHLLEEIDLSENKLNVGHAQHIAHAILAAVANGGRCALKKVNLSNCLIDVAGIKELAQCLHLLEEVDLSGNKLTVNHVRHISDGILLAVGNRGMSSLKKVNLAKSLIDVAGMKELVRCLHLVEEFDFSGNKLTVSHARFISDGILSAVADGGHFDIRKLDLRNCSIPSDGMVELERCLEHVEIVFN